MNCDWEIPGYMRSFCAPDCSPHPMDIVAIYALYQTVE